MSISMHAHTKTFFFKKKMMHRLDSIILDPEEVVALPTWTSTTSACINYECNFELKCNPEKQIKT